MAAGGELTVPSHTYTHSQPFTVDEHARFLAALDGLQAQTQPQAHQQQEEGQGAEGHGGGRQWRGDEWESLAAAVGNGRTALEVSQSVRRRGCKRQARFLAWAW